MRFLLTAFLLVGLITGSVVQAPEGHSSSHKIDKVKTEAISSTDNESNSNTIKDSGIGKDSGPNTMPYDGSSVKLLPIK